MKYCPYCGAFLLGGAVSFCPECGKSLRGQIQRARGARRERPPAKQEARKSQERIRRPKNSVDGSYDGYYDDVQPVDADQVEKQRDPELVKRIVCVVLGAVGIISLAVIVMIVL